MHSLNIRIMNIASGFIDWFLYWFLHELVCDVDQMRLLDYPAIVAVGSYRGFDELGYAAETPLRVVHDGLLDPFVELLGEADAAIRHEDILRRHGIYPLGVTDRSVILTSCKNCIKKLKMLIRT